MMWLDYTYIQLQLFETLMTEFYVLLIVHMDIIM